MAKAVKRSSSKAKKPKTLEDVSGFIPIFKGTKFPSSKKLTAGKYYIIPANDSNPMWGVTEPPPKYGVIPPPTPNPAGVGFLITGGNE
jgi:hypothetical protein